MSVVRGSPNALAWYPLGRIVAVDAKICLPANARFVTFQKMDGGLVTYGGGGCNKLIREPPPSGQRGGGWEGPT
ncbi:MAG: hypothetical protein H6920_00605 [Sphingomonadaceae bacterium]|jgi:hypothetical protein|nr:hypothetical protein [Altererythrobacter sp.]MCP5390115.1 hypothetical protein [Sphingomonadaceae bacterium]